MFNYILRLTNSGAYIKRYNFIFFNIYILVTPYQKINISNYIQEILESNYITEYKNFLNVTYYNISDDGKFAYSVYLEKCSFKIFKILKNNPKSRIIQHGFDGAYYIVGNNELFPVPLDVFNFMITKNIIKRESHCSYKLFYQSNLREEYLNRNAK